MPTTTVSDSPCELALFLRIALPALKIAHSPALARGGAALTTDTQFIAADGRPNAQAGAQSPAAQRYETFWSTGGAALAKVVMASISWIGRLPRGIRKARHPADLRRPNRRELPSQRQSDTPPVVRADPEMTGTIPR